MAAKKPVIKNSDRLIVDAFSTLPYQIVIDQDGLTDTDDTVVVNPKTWVRLYLPSEKRFLELSKEYPQVKFKKILEIDEE